MIRCLSCGAETSNGLALCGLCQEFASKCFVYLPIYFRNLARWRPGRAGSRPVLGSRVLYDGVTSGDGTGDRISDRVDEALTMATTRARELVEARTFPRPLTFNDAVLSDDLPQEVADELNDDPARAMAALCAGLEKHLTSIATLDWCGDLVADLGKHEEVLRKLTEALIPGWYAGGCGRCGSGTYVVPGLTWVTCGGCGATTYARDHLETVLDEARDWVDRPMRLAEAVVALVDTEQSVARLHKRISKWGERWPKAGIAPVRRVDGDGDDVGPKRYRLGDVLDRLASEGATRLNEETATKTVVAS